MNFIYKNKLNITKNICVLQFTKFKKLKNYCEVILFFNLFWFKNLYTFFQKQFFIRAGINTAHQNFLEWFTETAMFTSFINDKMHNNVNSIDVFEQRCTEFSLEFSKVKRKSKTLQSMKALGDRIKDWAVSWVINQLKTFKDKLCIIQRLRFSMCIFV